MAYQIVKKNSLRFVRNTTEIETKYISKPYEFGTEDWKAQQLFFTELKDCKYWIKCSCNNNAFIYIRTTSKKYYLYSLEADSRPSHEKGCKFKPVLNDGAQPPKKRLNDDDFVFFRKTSQTKTPNKPNADPKQVKRVKDNKLYSLLRHIAQDANLNKVIGGTRSSYEEQKENFLQGAAKRTINGVPVSQITFMNESQLSKVRKVMLSYETKNNVFPTSLLIWIASEYEIKDSYFTFKDINRNEQKIKNSNVSLHHPLGSEKKGPFLIATLCKFDNRERKFYYPQSYIVPIVSNECWMYVDSHYERLMAQSLIGRANYFKSNSQIYSKIIKPADLIETKDGDLVLPDFELEIKNSHFFIEVMGMNSWAYRERKADVIPKMTKIAPVFEFDACIPSTEQDLSDSIFNFCIHKFREFG